MTTEPFQIGDLVEILPAERPLGQPAPPRRYGRVLAVEAETDRATVQTEQRRYPLQLLLRQLRRVEH
jgi:hypothetical protein